MATAHNELCPELIVEIFTRLPTQSLLQFRSVSKSICGMIGSPDFIRLHAVRSPKKFTAIHRVNYKAEGITKSMYTINSQRIIHLWNPSIRRKATVLFVPVWTPGLAIGFGFDPSIDDYKILWTVRGGEVSFDYTMKTHTWREIASHADMDRLLVVKSPMMCLFNGALHWAVKRDSRRSGGCYVMTFDLSSEVFSTIELPEPSWETDTVTVIKGCLAVVSSSSKDVDASSRIWVRNTDAAWSPAFKLDMRQPVQSINSDLMFSRCYSSKGILDYHDPETGVPSRLVDLTGSSSYVNAMITCIESLELLHFGTSCHQGKHALDC
ncbi:putative F-box domain-containing protein [Helianthus annuus]|nr:putative F-box domain-containing protein [Helianthus annuus]